MDGDGYDDNLDNYAYHDDADRVDAGGDFERTRGERDYSDSKERWHFLQVAAPELAAEKKGGAGFKSGSYGGNEWEIIFQSC